MLPDIARLPQASLLERLEVANQALQEATTFREVKDVKDKVAAIQGYLKQRCASVEAINAASRIKIAAERRLGEMVADLPKNPGARTRFHDGTALPPTYQELGIKKVTAHRWQRIASIPESVIHKTIEEAAARGEVVTTNSILKLASPVRDDLCLRVQYAPTRQGSAVAAGTPTLPTGKQYSVILADPPWRYDAGTTTPNRTIEGQYPTMNLDDICNLPVRDIASRDAVLFLWSTSPKLEEAMRVVNSWGFSYRTSLVWIKHGAPGLGHYVRVNHEHLLIAIRGKPGTPERSGLVSSIIHAKKKGHSQKPEEAREIIEKMYPDAVRLEMFCRYPREGWDAWGNEVAPTT